MALYLYMFTHSTWMAQNFIEHGNNDSSPLVSYLLCIQTETALASSTKLLAKAYIYRTHTKFVLVLVNSMK